MRVKVYEDLYPEATGWACAVECDGTYEDGGPLTATDEEDAVAEARAKFPSAEEVIVGDPHTDDSADLW